MLGRKVLGFVVVLAALAGCSTTAEQQRARQYEAFLKRSIGDITLRYDRYAALPRGAASPAAAHD